LPVSRRYRPAADVELFRRLGFGWVDEAFPLRPFEVDRRARSGVVSRVAAAAFDRSPYSICGKIAQCGELRCVGHRVVVDDSLRDRREMAPRIFDRPFDLVVEARR